MIKNIAEKQTEILELKNIRTALKNLPEGFHSRFDQVEERISKITEGRLKIIRAEERKPTKKNVYKGKQTKRLMEHNQVNQHIHYGYSRRREKGGRKPLYLNELKQTNIKLKLAKEGNKKKNRTERENRKTVGKKINDTFLKDPQN